MKKSIILLLTTCIFTGNPLNAQFGKFINKVSKSVANEFTEKPDAAKAGSTEPEPKCACETPALIFDLGGKLQLMFSEITLNVSDDGTLLVKDKVSSDYYIVKDGVTQGPLKAGDARLKEFREADVEDDSNDNDNKTWNNEYISKTGEKYQIKFNGKTYGPYGVIRQFKVSRTKDKFAAEVIENVPISEADGEKMDEAIKNAKTEQEKMDLAMQYSQQMAKNIQAGGGAMSTVPKIVSNIPGVTLDLMKYMGGSLNSSSKYNEIIFTAYDKILDLQSNILVNLKQDALMAQNLYINTANTKYAWYKYGTLTFSDGSVMSDLFNPQLAKNEGSVYLTYMYYSPKSNAIMQCKIPF
jgi:hypothetical protein